MTDAPVMRIGFREVEALLDAQDSGVIHENLCGLGKLRRGKVSTTLELIAAQHQNYCC